MKKLLVCLVLAAAIGAAYYNALSNEFVFDDYMLVVESPVVQSSQSIVALSHVTDISRLSAVS